MQLMGKRQIVYNFFLSFFAFVRSEFDESVNDVHRPAYYKYVAKSSQFPWVVSFKTVEHCMGTLIHPSWVLTAAHCLEESSDPSYYILQLGYVSNKWAKHGQIETVSELHPYPRYRSSKISRVRDHEHDIALLKTNNPFKLAQTLPIRVIPYISDKHHKRPCHILGFVKEISNPHEEYKTLQFARVFGYTYDDCYSKSGDLEKFMMRHTLCTTGIERNTKEACSGNPGGPLVCPVKEAKWKQVTEIELVGVSSWNQPGIHCGAMSQYIDVGYFVEWLNATIEGEPYNMSQAIMARDVINERSLERCTNAAVGLMYRYYTVFFHVVTIYKFFFQCFQHL